ncbi:hypothetical protein BLNAU_22720 [Blattamonas nauphoetae]|uniref:Uncharacterized protein n=1 Tax=Blattamonas nauphoetae TaxID=2049346 RepID=A0ABQ9WSA1_9EUKA|nr:hypothetical protein BLNAU_22720 [Blattamonas nauphoetae]
MGMLDSSIWNCSPKVHLALVKADLIPQLINTLNPQSLPFAETVDLHANLMKTITYSLWLATPYYLRQLKTNDRNEQQAVCETILKQVLSPSEKYICHLCVNRYSIIDGDQSESLMAILAQLLEISPYYQPTMDLVVHLPVFLTIPSCLSFFDSDLTIRAFLSVMIDIQREWNKQGGEYRQMWKSVHRMLRMEGTEDVIEEKLQNDRYEVGGGLLTIRSN